MSEAAAAIDAVIEFWFVENGQAQWFAKDDAFDAAIRDRFGALRDELAGTPEKAEAWAKTPRGALAVLLVLDQFSRNLYRDDARAFEADPLARRIARTAVAQGFHTAEHLPPSAANFIFLPFEHSEDLADQDWSCALFEATGDANSIDYAERHRVIIERFGRFPHRNAVLGRSSTEEETAFLKQPGSGF